MDKQLEHSENFKDVSNDKGFQFEFLCPHCGQTRRSEFKRLKLNLFSSAMQSIVNLMIEFFGAVISEKSMRSFTWHSAHDYSLRKAVAEFKTQLSQCPKCHAWVCNENCWDMDNGFCNDCSPSAAFIADEKKVKTQSADTEEKRKTEVDAWEAMYVIVDLRTGVATGMDAPPNTKFMSNKAFANEYLVLRHIPAGEFMMGSLPIEPGHSDNETLHKVHLTCPFHIGVFPVTQGQWQLLMKSNPSGFPNMGATAPVENISWDDARGIGDSEDIPNPKSFIGVMRKRTGRPFDLPTEAQWEYACRAGSIIRIVTDSDVDKVGWFDRNCGGMTHPIGQKMPNAWGLYDMHGNVWEWCFDRYGPYKGDATDPTGCDLGSSRVVRGGCWGYHAAGCRAASRNRGRPNANVTCVGFRIVLLPSAIFNPDDVVK